jgi:hypothetical protein
MIEIALIAIASFGDHFDAGRPAALLFRCGADGDVFHR